MTQEIILMTLTFILIAVGWFIFGYEFGRAKSSGITPKDINAYIKRRHGETWASYQEGVNQGYAQGLRDGQDIPDEPA